MHLQNFIASYTCTFLVKRLSLLTDNVAFFIPAPIDDSTTVPTAEEITTGQSTTTTITDTMKSTTIESEATMQSASVQLSVGAIAGAAVGGGGAVILIVLVIVVAAFAAMRCRNKRKLSLETNPNQAYGVHNPTKKAMGEDKYYDSIDLKDTTPKDDIVIETSLIPLSNNISKNTEDALYEDMQAATGTEPTTDNTILSVNMAYGVLTDHVTVSPNQAYGATSIKKNDENEYRDSGPIYDEANEVETAHVMVSTNQAYGVTSVKRNKGICPIYDEANETDAGHVIVSTNQAYGVTVKRNNEDIGPIYEEANEADAGHVAASTNQAYGAIGT